MTPPITEEERTVRPLTAFVRNLRTGIRLFALQRVRAEDFTPGVGALVGGVLLELVTLLLCQRAVIGPGAVPDLYAFSGALFYLPLLLLVGYLVSRLTPVRQPLLLPLALVAATIPLEIVATCLDLLDRHRWLPLPDQLFSGNHFFPFFGWWFATVIVGTLRLYGFRIWLKAFPLLFLLVLPLWFMPRASFWMSSTSGYLSGQGSAGIAAEGAFYAQAHILERHLARLTPGVPGVPELYFVGLAGYAEENVFAHEVSLASRLFHERFGTGGHSITLVNNPGTVYRAPIASRTSLRRTLKKLGTIMNPEDVLFLFLTSHGSDDHRLEMSFLPLELEPLAPPELAAMLRESGIAWKVVVISACYSGGFMDSLKSDDTLVITASDAEHNSFGCGSESDITYFGKAYFDEALREETSFIDAFNVAREAIHRREQEEGETPSNPQIYVGKKIEAQLRRVEERSKGRGGEKK